MIGVRVNGRISAKCKLDAVNASYYFMDSVMQYFLISDGISSRSSNFLDHYSNVTAYDYNNNDQSHQAPTVESVDTIDTTNNQPSQYYEQAPSKGQWKWKWVWHPEGENSNSFIPQGHYRPNFYQEAQPRQGFLALLNPSTLVCEFSKNVRKEFQLSFIIFRLPLLVLFLELLQLGLHMQI